MIGWAIAFALAAPTGATPWGTLPDGHGVHRYVLKSQRGMTVTLTDLGAAIVSVELPGEQGRDVVTVAPTGFAEFTGSQRRYGAIVGRYAGRLPGAVTIAGRRYPLAVNASGVTLHGGDPGFDRAIWRARRVGPGAIEFTHRSTDGDQGFPGTLTVRARYALAQDRDALTLSLTATSDRATVVNLTNHVYFNLSGAATVGCHRLQASASRRLAVNERKLPVGPAPVAGTPLDFQRVRPLAPTLTAGGLDALLLLDRDNVSLSDPESGRRLTVTTNQPGVQLFTGNSFDGREHDARGRPIGQHAGIAIEPQRFLVGTGEVGSAGGLTTPKRPYRATMTWAFDRVAKGGCA